MLGGAYNNDYQIMQAPGYVMILAEMLHDVRIIPLDGRPQLPSNVRQWTGSYRGRWEGQTLVVETTKSHGQVRVPGREREHAFDRALHARGRGHDPLSIHGRRSCDVDESLVRRGTRGRRMTGPIFEHACHEGNYGLTNTLAGARAEEKRAAEEAAKKKSPKSRRTLTCE